MHSTVGIVASLDPSVQVQLERCYCRTRDCTVEREVPTCRRAKKSRPPRDSVRERRSGRRISVKTVQAMRVKAGEDDAHAAPAQFRLDRVAGKIRKSGSRDGVDTRQRAAARCASNPKNRSLAACRLSAFRGQYVCSSNDLRTSSRRSASGDKLTGSVRTDWFFTDLRDRITDSDKLSEVVN